MWQKFVITVFFFGISETLAQTNSDTQVSVSTASSEVNSVQSDTTPKSRTRGSVRREKEAEGTQALERFESDAIIKSRYRLNGQPLEVDTD